MKEFLAVVGLVFAATGALAQEMPKDLQPPPSERWFSITRSSAGFLAAGNLNGMLWAFHVRGQEFKWLGNGTPPMFAIDGVVMQVKIVSRMAFGGAADRMLDAHTRFEQDHQARTLKGVTFRDHDMCRSRFPHRQWLAESAGGITQAYVTFEVGEYVLMVVAPYENERRRQVVAKAVGDVCESFSREKAT